MLLLLCVLLQLARQEDELVILERSLTSIQEQLSSRVVEIIRLEQTERRLTTQLDDLTDSIAGRDDEIAKQNQTIGDTPPPLTVS